MTPGKRARAGGQLVSALILALGVASAWSIFRNCEGLRPLGVGQPAPPLQLKVIAGPRAGETVTLASLRGHPFLLQFWASWCEPCRAEMPELKRFFARHAGEGFTVVGISVGESPEDAQRFARAEQLPWLVASADGSDVTARYNVNSLPHMFWIDPTGNIKAQWIGPVGSDELEPLLK